MSSTHMVHQRWTHGDHSVVAAELAAPFVSLLPRIAGRARKCKIPFKRRPCLKPLLTHSRGHNQTLGAGRRWALVGCLAMRENWSGSTRAISSSLSIATTSHRPVAGEVLDCHTGNCPLSGLGAGDAPSLGSRLCNDDQLSAQLTAVDTAFIPHCEGRTGGQRLARSESTVVSNVVRPNGHLWVSWPQSWTIRSQITGPVPDMGLLVGSTGRAACAPRNGRRRPANRTRGVDKTHRPWVRHHSQRYATRTNTATWAAASPERPRVATPRSSMLYPQHRLRINPRDWIDAEAGCLIGERGHWRPPVCADARREKQSIHFGNRSMSRIHYVMSNSHRPPQDSGSTPVREARVESIQIAGGVWTQTRPPACWCCFPVLASWVDVDWVYMGLRGRAIGT